MPAGSGRVARFALESRAMSRAAEIRRIELLCPEPALLSFELFQMSSLEGANRIHFFLEVYAVSSTSKLAHSI